MISYRLVPISSQKGVLFLRHPVDEFQTLHPIRNRLKQQGRTNKRRKRNFGIGGGGV